MSATAPLETTLLTAATTGTSRPVDCRRLPNLSGYLIGAGVISAGTLLIEEAYFNPRTETTYDGTWSLIDTLDCTDVDGGAQLAVHFPAPQMAYGFVRARFSVDVTGGGTVTFVLLGNGAV